MSKLKLALESTDMFIEQEDITPVNIESMSFIEDDMNDIATENLDILSNLNSAIFALENLGDIFSQLRNNSKIDNDKLEHIKIAHEQMCLNKIYVENNLLITLEGYNEGTVSLESTENAVFAVVKSIFKHLGYVFKALAGWAQTSTTFFNFEGQRINSLRTRLNKLNKNTKVTFSVRESKYFRYGDNGKLVTSFADYKNQYISSMNDVIKLVDAVSVFEDKNLFQSLKTLVSPITGYEDKFIEMFNDLDDFFDKVSSITKIKKTKSFLGFDNSVNLESEVYLGMSHILLARPKKETFKKDDFKSCRSVMNFFGLSFIRNDKFELPIFNSKVTFENVTVKDILEILDCSEKVNKAYIKQVSIANKLSAFGDFHVIINWFTRAYSGGFALGMGAVAPAVLILLPFFLANYRLLTYTSMILFNNSKESFLFSKGNVKNANIVAEEFLHQAE